MKTRLIYLLLNGLKLCLACILLLLATAFCAAFLSSEGPKPTAAETGLGIGIIITGLGTGIWLLWSFLRSVRRQSNKISQTPCSGPETRFYSHNKNWLQLFEGWSFNGCGSMSLTRNRRAEDGSYESIVWLTLFYMPLWPLYQERVSRLQQQKSIYIPFLFSYTDTAYRRMQPVPLRRRLIWLTCVFYYLLWLPALIMPVVLLLVYLDELNRAFPGPWFWLLIAGYFAWGVCWMALMEFWNKRLFLKR